jgi:hypothetical protein
MNKAHIMLLVALLLGTALVFNHCGQQNKLIPRQLCSAIRQAALRISPDHQMVSFLAPVNGVLNVWAAPANDIASAAAVTNDTLRGIRIYFWAYNNDQILYLQDLGGDENWQVHAVNIKTKEDRNLTPFEEIPGPDGQPVTLPNGQKLRPEPRSSCEPQISRRNSDRPEQPQSAIPRSLSPEHPDARWNGATERPLCGFQTDDDYAVRYALQMTPDGGNEIFVKDQRGNWKSFDKIPMQDALSTSPITFDKTGELHYMIDSRGRNTAVLTSLNLKTKEKKVIFEDPRADLSNIMIHPTEKTIEAAACDYLRTEWTILDPSIQPDMDYLKTWPKAICLSPTVLWTTASGGRLYERQQPVLYYLYDRAAKKATYLFSNRQDLEKVRLAKRHPVVIQSKTAWISSAI